MKRFVAVIGLVLSAFLSQANAQQSPDDQYIAIYNQIQQADSTEQSGQMRSALAQYTQAQAELAQFQKTNPDWDASIIKYRLQYLAGKISELTAQMPATNAPAATTETIPAAPAQANPSANVQGPSVADLQAQVQNLQLANESLQAKLKEALGVQPAMADTQEMAQVQEQERSLMKENDLLRATINSGTNNAMTAAELQALQSTNEMLQEKLSQALNTPVVIPDTQELAQAQDQIRTLMKENDLLRATMNAPSTNTTAPMDIIQELNTLRARVAVDEAQSIPYTSDELALLRAASPKPQAAAGTEAQPATQLPQGSELLVAEAQDYFSNKEFDKAEADYLKILATDPNNALVLANLATIEMEENKLVDAENHINTALAQTPNDPYDLSILGNLEYRQGKYDDALNALSRAAKLDPQNPVIENYLGVTLSHKGLREQAETALRKAIELNPNYGDAHNNLAVIYMGENPPPVQLARWHYQKALDAGEPRNADLEKMLADKGAPVDQQ